MTSYQKLKQRISKLESENEKLKEDLRTLVLDGESLDAEIIRGSVKFKDNAEKALMAGRPLVGVRVKPMLENPIYHINPLLD